MLGGKNTLMRMGLGKDHPLTQYVHGNVGLVFAEEDHMAVGAVLDALSSTATWRELRLKDTLPMGLTLAPGPTHCPPTQTSWFQALGVPTQIRRGQIDIVAPVQVLAPCEKATASVCSLAAKLGLKPVRTVPRAVVMFADHRIEALPDPVPMTPDNVDALHVGLEALRALAVDARAYPTSDIVMLKALDLVTKLGKLAQQAETLPVSDLDSEQAHSEIDTDDAPGAGLFDDDDDW